MIYKLAFFLSGALAVGQVGENFTKIDPNVDYSTQQVQKAGSQVNEDPNIVVNLKKKVVSNIPEPSTANNDQELPSGISESEVA